MNKEPKHRRYSQGLILLFCLFLSHCGPLYYRPVGDGASRTKKVPNDTLVIQRGDLYVEVSGTYQSIPRFTCLVDNKSKFSYTLLPNNVLLRTDQGDVVLGDMPYYGSKPFYKISHSYPETVRYPNSFEEIRIDPDHFVEFRFRFNTWKIDSQTKKRVSYDKTQVSLSLTFIQESTGEQLSFSARFEPMKK